MPEPGGMNGHRLPAPADAGRESRPAAGRDRARARAGREAAYRRARGVDSRPLSHHLRGDLGGRTPRAASARDRQEEKQNAAHLDVQPGRGPVRGRAPARQDRGGQHVRPGRGARRRARLCRARHLPVQRPARSSRYPRLPGQSEEYPPPARRRPRPARHLQDGRTGVADHEDPGGAVQGRRRGRVRHAVGRRLQQAARSHHR